MAESEQITNPKKFRIPKIFKNRLFIFGVSSGLFLLSIFVLIFADKSNVIFIDKPEQGYFCPVWLKAINDWFIRSGLAFDVNMSTWFLFFLVFGLFFFIFFSLCFHKSMLNKKKDKIARKYDREMTGGEKARFNLIFFGILVLLLGAAVAGGMVFLSMTGYFATIASQMGNFLGTVTNFFIALGLLLALILVVPVTFALLLLIFRFFITIISLIVGGVSNSVMRSEGFQKNMAASQAAASDIERSMREARERAGESVRAARDAAYGNGGGGSNTPQADILFPALTTIDFKWKKIEDEKAAALKAEEDKKAELLAKQDPNNPQPEVVEEVKEEDPNARPPLDYEQFKLLAFEFQSYLCHEKYYFKINTLRSFIAGLAAARLILLQGLSGTGKSTLPRVFLEYVGGDAYFFPVQATWRDRSDITGYYSDFTGQFKETELLKHLYEASYIPETCNLMVLDEMNISRVEYYFADFLSIFEYPAEDWVVPLMQVKPGTVLPKYIENGMVRIPVNTWFVGTVNIDDSTFTITDKVYDRAIAIDFNELNLPFESSYRFDKHPIKITELQAMFKECKERKENNLTPAERKKFLDLTQFISDTFDIQFGNRIMNQIDNFLPVFVGLGGTKNEALDVMIARKVLRKLEGKFESYIKDGLNKLTRYINSQYGKHALPESEAVIEKYRRKLS